MSHSTAKEFKIEARQLALHWAAIAVDAVFLAMWAALEYIIHTCVLNRLELPGVLNWVRYAFEGVFAVSTLAPVAIHIYKDITLMFLRAQREIIQELSANLAGHQHGGSAESASLALGKVADVEQ